MNTTTTNTFEAHRPEPVPLTKMDTSLEHALNKHNDISLLSPSSATSEFLNSDRGCHHNKLIHYGNYDNCFHCGAFVSKTGSKTLNSKKMSYVAFFPPKTIYETMTRRSAYHKQSTNPEYSQIRQTYVEWVLEIADKLKISPNSSHLAIILLDTIMFKEISLTSQIQLYAPVCLLIAAKTIELDERIPFIPKLRRYANPTFSVDEYAKAELHVLDMVDWNAQFGTPIEISEFLMSQGVLFSTDEIEDNILAGKLSPEALRENNGNTNYTEVKGEDKKDAGISSPSSKENNENSYSENPAGAEPAAVATLQQVAQQGEDVSPAAKVMIPVYHKQQSSPANFETNSLSVTRTVTSVEKKAGEIMSHFETSYVKLSTLLVKDVEFVEWEPKVVAASMMAFFRCINKITPIWNGELETITQLKFVQISTCFDLIYKKYNTAFNLNTSKALHIINVTGNQEIPESKLTRANTIAVEKAGFAQPKTELSNKTNIINNASNTKPSDAVLNESKPLERKQIFAYQAKANLPAANPTTAAAYNNNMRDDLRLRTKYANGTINTEIPQRNTVRNVPSNYQTARYNSSQEYAAGYYNNSANASFSTATGSYSSAGGSLVDTSYAKTESYHQSRNPSISFLDHSAFENYQAKLKK